VVVATPNTTVSEAAQLMRRNHVGTVVVCETRNGGKRIPVGIVTDRDIVVEVVAPELRPDTITVGDIMSRKLVRVAETEDILKAVEIMRTHGVRRLPVVGKGGSLVGLLSTDDLARLLPGELADIGTIVARERARESATRK
jgi:CBS domain-containing protein